MTDDAKPEFAWRRRLAVVITLGALVVAAVAFTDLLSCLGCGGLTFAPGTSPAEQVAAMRRVRRLTVTAVVTSIVFVVLVSASALAWRSGHK